MEQTNRTILFEEINPDMMDLYTLIGNVKGKKSISDMELEEIHQKLLVKSFDEFMQKFSPKLYGFVDTDNLTFSFSYQRKWNHKNMFCISLNSENRFFQEIFCLLSTHKENYVPLESIQDLFHFILKSEKARNLKKLKGELNQKFTKGNLQEINVVLEHIIENYDSGIVLLQYFLMTFPEYINFIKSDEKEPLVIKETKGTQIEILTMSEKFKYFEPSIEEGLYAYISEYLNNKVCNQELLELCLRMETFKKEDLGYLCEKYSIYQEFYSKILKIMWEYIRPLVQSIFGVYEFFNQYSDTAGKMAPSLLIANCKPESIQIGENKARLKTYLETVNLKNYAESNIWYAVIPGLSYKPDDMKAKVRERFQGTEQKKYVIPNQPEDIVILCELLAEYKILSFIGIQAKSDTNFMAFAKNGIETYNASFKELGNINKKEYVVPCLPNFTIIPKEHMEIKIGNIYSYQEFIDSQIISQGKKKIWLEGIYVDAAYVAAGLMASCQCPEYLHRHFKEKVMMEFPGVSYRITQEDNKYITKTVMKKEVFYYQRKLLDDIENRSMGIVFMPCNQGVVVATDRCMSFQTGKNDCVATVQTLRYMEQIIQRSTQDFKSELIKNFFQNRPNSTKDKWCSNRQFINSILKEGEKLTYQLNETDGYCIFKVEFQNISKDKRVNISK